MNHICCVECSQYYTNDTKSKLVTIYEVKYMNMGFDFWPHILIYWFFQTIDSRKAEGKSMKRQKSQFGWGGTVGGFLLLFLQRLKVWFWRPMGKAYILMACETMYLRIKKLKHLLGENKISAFIILWTHSWFHGSKTRSWSNCITPTST